VIFLSTKQAEARKYYNVENELWRTFREMRHNWRIYCQKDDGAVDDGEKAHHALDHISLPCRPRVVVISRPRRPLSLFGFSPVPPPRAWRQRSAQARRVVIRRTNI
jgi:hypothetical protein